MYITQSAITLYRLSEGRLEDDVIYVHDKRKRYDTGDILTICNSSKSIERKYKVRAVTKAFLFLHGINGAMDKQFCASEKLLSEFGDPTQPIHVYELGIDKNQKKFHRECNQDPNYNVALNLIKAQIASDEEKAISFEHRLKTHHEFNSNKTYEGRTTYILKALRLIKNSKTDFRFCIKRHQPDQKGYDSMIVLFETTTEKGYVQISYHIPIYDGMTNDEYEIYESLGDSSPIEWNSKCRNRKSCEKLIKKYDI